MNIKKAQGKYMLSKIRRLYESSFPKNEKKSFKLILKKRKQGIMDILYLEEDNKFCGLALTIKYNDIVLLDYFAIRQDLRDKGHGSKALQMIFDYYKGCRLILEMETTRYNEPNKLRRKNFYIKNGMVNLDFDINLFGVEMETLCKGCPVSYDEYMEVHSKSFGTWVLKYVKGINYEEGTVSN